MNRITGFIFFSFIMIQAGAGYSQEKPATKFSLKQCIETAISNNLDVKLSQSQMQSDEINWKQAKLNLLPNVNGSASENFNQGRSIDPFTNAPVTQSYSSAGFGISGGIVLFNGLSMQNTIKQNAATYQASKMDWQQQKDNLTINVILAYLKVLGSRDQLQQIKNQAALSGSQVDRLETLNKEGAIPPSDLSTLKGTYAGDQLAVLNAQNALETSKITLCQLMNIPYDSSMQLEDIETGDYAIKYPDEPTAIYQTALEKLALVKSADLRLQSAGKAVKVAKGQLYPRLTFNGNTFTNYSSVATQNLYVNSTNVTSSDYVNVNGSNYPVIRKQDNFSVNKISFNDQFHNNLYTTFGFNLSIPIFNSLQQRNKVKLTQLNFKTKEYVANTTKTQLNQSVNQAYLNMNTAYESYKAVLDQVKSYEEAFHAAEVRFNNGVGTPVDYLIAKNNFDRATITLINSKYELVLRNKILDYYEGKALW